MKIEKLYTKPIIFIINNRKKFNIFIMNDYIPSVKYWKYYLFVHNVCMHAG